MCPAAFILESWWLRSRRSFPMSIFSSTTARQQRQQRALCSSALTRPSSIPFCWTATSTIGAHPRHTGYGVAAALYLDAGTVPGGMIRPVAEELLKAMKNASPPSPSAYGRRAPKAAILAEIATCLRTYRPLTARADLGSAPHVVGATDCNDRRLGRWPDYVEGRSKSSGRLLFGARSAVGGNSPEAGLWGLHAGKWPLSIRDGSAISSPRPRHLSGMTAK